MDKIDKRTVTVIVNHTQGTIEEIVTVDPEDIYCGECHKNWQWCECLHPPYLKSEREDW